MTKFGATRVPPQKWLPRRCRDTMKGHAWGRACWPPTISEASAGPGHSGSQAPARAAGGPRLRAVRPRAPTGQGPSRACRQTRKLRHRAWPSSVQLWTPGPKAWAPPPEVSLPIPLITAPREDEGAVRFRVQWGGGNRHPGTDGQTCGPTHRPAARSAGRKPGRGWRLHSVGPWPREAGVRSCPPGPLMALPGGRLHCPTSSPPPRPGR